MPVYNKPTIQTSGNLSGNGRFDNPVALKDKINLTEITASQLKITGTASIAQLNTLSQTELLVGDKYIVIMSGGTDHLSLDGSGILWGSGSTDPTVGPRGENANILFNGTADRLEIFPGISSSFISGTFIGNGANLTNILPNISESHVVYVSSHSTNAGADGTLKKPFQTVTGALQHIENNINPDDPVLVNLLPGTYDSFTVTRHDTYFKSDFGRDRQRAVIVNGPVIVATDGTQKYNDIIGFEGIFFNTSGGENSVPVVEISGSGKGVTYFDDCYIASSGSAECLKLNNTLTFDNNKLVLRNTTFLGQKMGPDLLSINGGDAELDTCKFYYSSGPVSTGSAVVATGDSYVVADRCLVDVRTNDYPIDLQSATSASVFTNCAIGSTGTTSPGLLYTTKPLTLWNILFTGNSLYNNLILTGSTAGAQIYYSSLNSAIPLTTSGVTMNPLTETHGRVIASALSGNLSSSYLVGAVPVNRGGTGATSFTSASLLIGNATDAFGTINPATSGNLLVSNGTTWTSIGSGSIGGVTGGTTNYIPVWTGANTISTSSLALVASDPSNIVSEVAELTINGRPANPALIGYYDGGNIIIKGGNGDRLPIFTGGYSYYSGGDVILSGGINPYDGSSHGNVKIISGNELHLTASRIHVSGTIQNNLKLNDTSGIIFGVTYGEVGGGNGTSKTLDDYEEGSWTPQFTYNGTSTGQLTTGNSGYYVKIGKKVTCTGYIDCSGGSFAPSDGGGDFLQISGLPFLSKTTGNEPAGALIVTRQDGWSGTQNIPVYGPIESNQTKVNRLQSGGSDLPYMNGNSWTVSLTLRFVLEYISAT